ncbi:hypothetical protein Tco_1033283 [Tanacetum coccineum]|uniref:Uncharacterized protein n=1 Tax=Tanacetum coccineum TaxID=301880 RepID=A0ABQ5GE81_9ASTR
MVLKGIAKVDIGSCDMGLYGKVMVLFDGAEVEVRGMMNSNLAGKSGFICFGVNRARFPRTLSYWFTHTALSALRRSVKELQERCTIKAFKLSNQEKYEHVGPKVTSTQDGKDYKMAKRDYAWLMISRSSRSHSCQVKDTSQSLKSKITTSIDKLMIEVKDYKLKTKVKA